MISPSCMSQSGTSPPSGVNESCIALTEPLEAAVVAVAQSAEFTTPNRTLLAPPCCRRPGQRLHAGRRPRRQ